MALILTVLHILVCLFLVFVVLLQSGQAADLAGAFGGGGSQTAFGMRGAATLLQKLTTASAIVFMLTSLSLGIVGRSSSSVIEDIDQPPVSGPAQAGQPPAGDAGHGSGQGGQGSGQTDQGSGQGGQGSGQTDPGSGSGQTGQGGR